jgi:hypothetical protein
MPITAFNSFTDGLDPTRRSREHFITNINLEDDRLWVPCANGVWFWTKRNGGIYGLAKYRQNSRAFPRLNSSLHREAMLALLIN